MSTKNETLDLARAKLKLQEAKTAYELAYAASFKSASDLALSRYRIKNPTRKDLETIILSDPVVASSRLAVDVAERALVDLKESLETKGDQNEPAVVAPTSPLSDALSELDQISIEGQSETLKVYFEIVSGSIDAVESSLSSLRDRIEDKKSGDYSTETESRVCEYASLYFGELVDYENHLSHIKWLVRRGSLAERLVDDEIKRSRRLQTSAQKLIDLTKIMLRGY